MSYILTKNNNEVIYEDQYEKVNVKIDKNHFVDMIQITEPEELHYPNDILYSLQNPIDSLPLKRLARGANNVVIIIPDATRGVPVKLVFPFIIKELSEAGVKLEQIKVVIALGVHRKSTPDEILSMIGELFFNKIKVKNHDPYDKNKLVSLGITKYGTPLEINKIVFESDFRITIGKVEPHEFAGFTGGRKAIFPGVCSENTIRVNHRPEMIMEENSRPGSLEKNSIHLDMLEAIRLLKVHFSVNFVLNSKNKPIGLFSGDIFSAHQKAVNFLKSYCKVVLNGFPDIIITTPGYPLNIDFYQSIKPLIALESVCKQGSVVILYSSCPEGINSPDMLLPFKNSRTINEVIDKLKKDYQIQMDHTLLLTRILNKGIRLIALSPDVQPSLFKTMYIEPAYNLQQALYLAYSFFNKKKNDFKILIFPQAQRTLPTIGIKN